MRDWMKLYTFSLFLNFSTVSTDTICLTSFSQDSDFFPETSLLKVSSDLMSSDSWLVSSDQLDPSAAFTEAWMSYWNEGTSPFIHMDEEVFLVMVLDHHKLSLCLCPPSLLSCLHPFFFLYLKWTVSRWTEIKLNYYWTNECLHITFFNWIKYQSKWHFHKRKSSQCLLCN